MEVPAEIGVRQAGDNDFDPVAQLWHQSALAMDGKPGVPPPEALRSRIEVELQSGWELHVAVREQCVVGMLALKPNDATLDQIFVLPTQQGQGVGAALMHIAKLAMPKGFTLRMAASNERAGKFYEKHGMVWLRDGIHPSTNIPVQFYGWIVR